MQRSQWPGRSMKPNAIALIRSKKLKFKPYGKASPLYGTVSIPLPLLEQIEIKCLSLLIRSAYMLTRRRTSRLLLERRPGSVWSASLIYGWRLLW